MRSLLAVLLAGLFVGCTTRCYSQETTATVLVTVKVTKNPGTPVAASLVTLPDQCTLCTQINDPAYTKENSKESVLAFRLVKSQATQISLKCIGKDIKSVILEDHRLPFTITQDGIRFVIPGQIADRPNSGEFQTHLFWRGVELRFEHADIARRDGKYKDGAFPLTQRRAASNIEFGLLEAIWRLGLDSYVDQENLGRLFLMGFDTNEPHGHEDFPPHFHLTLWLPTFKANGSLIPHVYLNPSGNIDRSLVGIYGWKLPSSFTYKAGETFTSVDTLSRTVFTFTFDGEGRIRLGRSDGATCEIEPVAGTFNKGAQVQCPSFPKTVVEVVDDLEASQITERLDGKEARVFRYDPETGEPM